MAAIKRLSNIYISVYGGFLCAIHALIGFFKVNEFIFNIFKLKMMLIFKMVANIQINMDQCCYTKIIYNVYFNFLPATRSS